MEKFGALESSEKPISCPRRSMVVTRRETGKGMIEAKKKTACDKRGNTEIKQIKQRQPCPLKATVKSGQNTPSGDRRRRPRNKINVPFDNSENHTNK